MQGIWVPSLVWEDPTCLRTTKFMRHNYWSLSILEAILPNKRNYCNMNPKHGNEEKAHTQQQRPSTAKNK